MFQQIESFYKTLVPSLTDDEWSVIEKLFTIKHIKKGDYLIKEGQVCNHVFFINKGLVRIYYTVNGKEISVGFAPVNHYISEYESFLTRKPSIQIIDALADTEAIELSYNHIQNLYHQYPVFQEFGRKIAEHLFIMINQRNTALLALSPEKRYQQMIVNANLLQVVPQYMLASYIGITPEHLSRIRKKLSIK
jgi:CRP-like cAMP-binding protein